MPPLLEVVANKYNIKPITFHKPVEGGYLSQNQIIGNQDAGYFLKQYRFQDERQIEAIHRAKFFFGRGNIPVILPLDRRSGKTYFSFEGQVYALFHFVSGRHLIRGQVPETALTAMAETLARMHLLGKGVDLPGIKARSFGWNREKTASLVTDAETILGMISAKPHKDDFDRLAEDALHLKLTLAQQYAGAPAPLLPGADHLIHGDFHDANLFFDEADRVKAVFDLERVCLWPRVLEIIRAVDFICFSDGSQSGRAFEDWNFVAAHTFLTAYHQRYPLDRVELINGYKNYFIRRVQGLWVETEHYLNNNCRVDGFLTGEPDLLRYFSQNLDTFIERIVEGVFA